MTKDAVPKDSLLIFRGTSPKLSGSSNGQEVKESPLTSDSSTRPSISTTATTTDTSTYPLRPSLLAQVTWVALVAPMIIMDILCLFSSNRDAPQLLTHIDSSLGIELEEKNYGVDCSNIWDKVIDPFMPCHFIGWLVAVLFLKDWKVVVGMFVVDELLEVWWAPAYPNFVECWWDTLILDILLCNTLGMLMGLAILRYYNVETQDLLKGWRQEPRRAIWFYSVVGTRPFLFLNLLAWKNGMWVPSGHWFNIWRMMGYIVSGHVASINVNNFANFRKLDLKWFWLNICLVIVELIHTLKMGYWDKIWEISAEWQRTMTFVFLFTFFTSYLIFPHFDRRTAETKVPQYCQSQAGYRIPSPKKAA